MSQVTEQSVRFQTALASIKLIQASAVLDLTEDDFDFLTSNKVWIATDRSRARRCVEACVYGTLDFVGYPRFPAPVEFIAAVIAYYVHPVTFKRPVSSWKALNLRKTLLMASSVRLKPLNCSRLPCVYAQETLTFLLTQKKTCVKNYVQDRKSGSAGMPRPISYAVFCLKKQITKKVTTKDIKSKKGYSRLKSKGRSQRRTTKSRTCDRTAGAGSERRGIRSSSRTTRRTGR